MLIKVILDQDFYDPVSLSKLRYEVILVVFILTWRNATINPTTPMISNRWRNQL